MKLFLGSLFTLVLPFAAAYADGAHHRPPQAAFDACAKSKAGDACSVKFHEQTLSGVCGPAHDSSALVCRPDHPPVPPQAAIDACNGRTEGDACSLTHDGHDVAGTCSRGHANANGPLACRPSHHHHHE
jgi:hypothetical protein